VGSSPDEVFFFSIDLIFPAALCPPKVDSASNRNEYQKYSWGIKGGRRVKLTTLPSFVSRLSRENVGASTSHNPMGLHGLLQEQLYIFLALLNLRLS
jgi:hypothetical protein